MTRQERIEQAAREITNKYPFEDYGDNEVVYHHLAMVDMANWALSHQWISVDEELPSVDNHGYSNKVLVKNKFNPNDVFIATYSDISKQWLSDGYKFDVTHWMEIPTLKGGEK